MDKALMEHLANLAEEHHCTIVFLDKSIWTPEKLIQMQEALLKIIDEDAKVKVH